MERGKEIFMWVITWDLNLVNVFLLGRFGGEIILQILDRIGIIYKGQGNKINTFRNSEINICPIL
jgi:hypothetical protein